LNFGNERSRRHRPHSLGPPSGLRPSAHRRVRKDKFADDIRVLRINLLNPFVFCERFLPFALPAFNRRDQPANISIARG
jgi:hypothetical protein